MKDKQLPFFDPDSTDGGNEFDYDRWSELIHSEDLISEEIKKIDKLYTRKDHITGLPMGFKDLDRMTCGLQNGELIIVGARPSMGKTAFVSSIVENIAVGHKVGVAYFSLDMSRNQLTQRILVSRAKIDAHKVRSGFLSPSDWPRLIKAADEIREANIFIDDTSLISFEELRNKVLWLKCNRDIKLVVVDPIQLLHEFVKAAGCPKGLEKVARSLKSLAVELDVPVIILSQLSPDIESRGIEDFWPRLVDLPGGGTVARSADVVLFLMREEYYDPTEENSGIANVVIAKHNSGSTGTIKLCFKRECMRFENLGQENFN